MRALYPLLTNICLASYCSCPLQSDAKFSFLAPTATPQSHTMTQRYCLMHLSQSHWEAAMLVGSTLIKCVQLCTLTAIEPPGKCRLQMKASL